MAHINTLAIPGSAFSAQTSSFAPVIGPSNFLRHRESYTPHYEEGSSTEATPSIITTLKTTSAHDGQPLPSKQLVVRDSKMAYAPQEASAHEIASVEEQAKEQRLAATARPSIRGETVDHEASLGETEHVATIILRDLMIKSTATDPIVATATSEAPPSQSSPNQTKYESKGQKVVDAMLTVIADLLTALFLTILLMLGLLIICLCSIYLYACIMDRIDAWRKKDATPDGDRDGDGAVDGNGDGNGNGDGDTGDVQIQMSDLSEKETP